jgi:hypothetical protein
MSGIKGTRRKDVSERLKAVSRGRPVLTKKGLPDRTVTGAELANIRWARTPPEKRAEVMSEVSKARWSKMTPQARTDYMTELAKRPRPSGRLPAKMRCPCGIMSLDRAKKRNHKCR